MNSNCLFNTRIKSGIPILVVLLFLNFCQKKNSSDEAKEEISEEISAPKQDMHSKDSGSQGKEKVEYYELFRLNHQGKIEAKNRISDRDISSKKAHSRVYYNSSESPNHTKYDKLLREEHYDENGQLLHYSKFEYKEDQMTEQRGFDAFHNPIYRRFYGADEKLVKEEILEWEEVSELIMYFYDSDGYKNKEEHYDPFGQLSFYSTFVYQKTGQKEDFKANSEPITQAKRDSSDLLGLKQSKAELREHAEKEGKKKGEKKMLEKKLLEIRFYNPEGKHLSTFTEAEHH